MTRSQKIRARKQCQSDKFTLGNRVELTKGGAYTDKGGKEISRTQYKVPPMASRRTTGTSTFAPMRCKETRRA